MPTAAALVIVEQAGGDIAADDRRQAHARTVSCQTIGDAVASLANLEAEIPAEIMAGETYYLSHTSTQLLVDITELRLRRIAQICESEKAQIAWQKLQVMSQTSTRGLARALNAADCYRPASPFFDSKMAVRTFRTVQVREGASG